MTIETMFRPLATDEICSAGISSVDEWHPVVPVPLDAPTLTNSALTRWASPGYSFTAGWRYNDAAGALLGFVVRYDRPTDGSRADKEVVPITFCQGPGGRCEWRKKSWGISAPALRARPSGAEACRSRPCRRGSESGRRRAKAVSGSCSCHLSWRV